MVKQSFDHMITSRIIPDCLELDFTQNLIVIQLLVLFDYKVCTLLIDETNGLLFLRMTCLVTK